VVSSLLGGWTNVHRMLKPILLAVSWVLSATKLDPVMNGLSDTILNPLQATHFAGAILLLLVLLLEVGGRRSRRLVSPPAPSGFPVRV
jgi:hypothetical protein